MDFTRQLVDALASTQSTAKVIFLSSIHVDSPGIYGETKVEAEKILLKYAEDFQRELYIMRLPNVFGKWSKPNHNSFLATLCWKIQRKEVYDLDDPLKSLDFIYIDTLVENLVNTIVGSPKTDNHFIQVSGTQTRKLGYIESRLLYFNGINELDLPVFEDEFDRELFAVFQYFTPEANITTPLKFTRDARGSFTEIFHSIKSGQISFLVCNPGQSRGHHFHNTKVENFVHVSGEGKFVAKDLKTQEEYEYELSDTYPIRVRAIPGWFHSVYNTGAVPLVIAIWASEIFNEEKPDTYYRSLNDQ